jgi:hypothetical protein
MGWRVKILPTRRWLIAAYSDAQTDRQNILQDINNDIDYFKRFSQSQPFPYELALDIVWFDADSAGVKRYKSESDFLDYNVIPSLAEMYTKLDDYVGLVLLLDRDLLIRNEINTLYVPTIKREFFKAKKHPFNFVCCFGGTPQDGMRCSVVPKSGNICQIRAHGCTTCEPDDKIEMCRHTCYWFFIGLLLGAHSKSKLSYGQSDEGIRRELPLPYIY